VLVVIPKETPLLSRELIYTALTRAKRRLVLLLEGNDSSVLFDLTVRNAVKRLVATPTCSPVAFAAPTSMCLRRAPSAPHESWRARAVKE